MLNKASLVGLKGFSDEHGAPEFLRARTLRNDHVRQYELKDAFVPTIRETCSCTLRCRDADRCWTYRFPYVQVG